MVYNMKKLCKLAFLALALTTTFAACGPNGKDKKQTDKTVSDSTATDDDAQPNTGCD